MSNKMLDSFVWAVLCRKSIIESGTNSLSMIDIVERFNAETIQEVPISDPPEKIPADLALVSFWYSEASKKKISLDTRFVFVSPDGVERGTAKQSIDLVQGKPARVIVKIPSFEYLGDGLYHWIVECREDEGDWQRCAKIPFPVNVSVVPEEFESGNKKN